MFYIRTGDKVSQPFNIPVWVKLLSTLFACYFGWVTVEYINIQRMTEELVVVEATTINKYAMVDHYDSLISDLNQYNQKNESVIEFLQRNKLNESPATK